MYRGFNLSLGELDLSIYEQEGRNKCSEQKAVVEKTLMGFTGPGGEIDASKMRKHWFPEIKTHVFISHSHKDECLALQWAGFLWSELGITSFVDSCAWGYANELLRIVDDEHCYNDQTKTYYYEKRNGSTSHVHMMLSVALADMIDACECLFFVNTPSAITPKGTIASGDPRTGSAWIFHELAMSRLIRRKTVAEHRGIKLAKAINEQRELEVSHEVSIDHLTNIGKQTINDWYAISRVDIELRGERALDKLYGMT